MGFVILFWIVTIGIVIVQIVAIQSYMQHGERSTVYGEYANQVIENTKVVVDAMKSRKIKKHLLSNSSEKYDSGKTLEKYKKFIESDLMSDMMQMREEQYHG